jgi:assimilatory nitrate reductase catalytic subunit
MQVGRDTRPFDDGRFYHADSRARLVATEPQAAVHQPDGQFPLILNTGRIRDQWHTMTRTGKAARLNDHLAEPYVDMHEQDALMSGVRQGQLLRVSTRWGTCIGRLRVSGEMPRGMIFAPIHWSDAFSSDARVGSLVNPVVDPISGEPEFKHTPARVEPFMVDWYGFILSRQPLNVTDITWWSCSQGNQLLRYELAGRGREHGSAWVRQLLNASAAGADWLDYTDDGSGVYRGAHLIDDRLEACVFISPRPDLPARTWLSALFARGALEGADRASLLTGQPPGAACDVGPVVCSCFAVGRNTICNAIRKFKSSTPQQIGHRLRAGTNCGSCLPELKAILEAETSLT